MSFHSSHGLIYNKTQKQPKWQCFKLQYCTVNCTCFRESRQKLLRSELGVRPDRLSLLSAEERVDTVDSVRRMKCRVRVQAEQVQGSTVVQRMSLTTKYPALGEHGTRCGQQAVGHVGSVHGYRLDQTYADAACSLESRWCAQKRCYN